MSFPGVPQRYLAMFSVAPKEKGVRSFQSQKTPTEVKYIPNRSTYHLHNLQPIPSPSLSTQTVLPTSISLPSPPSSFFPNKYLKNRNESGKSE